MGGQVELISIIVSTYNWLRALRVVLQSLARQSDLNFEVVVADDGSTPDTGELIKLLAVNYPVSLRQVWQEDMGYRLAASRNNAVSASLGNYLIFIDGDCLIRSDFVAIHRCLAERGWFVAGNRILINEAMTEAVLDQSKQVEGFTMSEFMSARLKGDVNRILPLLRLPDGFFRKLRPFSWQKAIGCNLGVWRNDYYKVNGFDESFIGWGHEDAEFVSRLINSGIYRKDGRFAAPVLHLWHRLQDRDDKERNMCRLKEHIALKMSRAEVGIDGY